MLPNGLCCSIWLGFWLWKGTCIIIIWNINNNLILHAQNIILCVWKTVLLVLAFNAILYSSVPYRPWFEHPIICGPLFHYFTTFVFTTFAQSCDKSEAFYQPLDWLIRSSHQQKHPRQPSLHWSEKFVLVPSFWISDQTNWM